MCRKILTLLIFCFVTTAIAIALEETPEQRRARWDQGPQTIDVSSYPEEMQETYPLFSERCSKCHNLARPINAEFKTSDWERYVKRMMRKPGSGISPQEGKKIFAFLKHDTRVRKPALADE